MKLYSLTKLSGDTVAVSDVIEKEGYIFLTSPEAKVDIPLYAIKCNHEFIQFYREKLHDREDIRDS